MVTTERGVDAPWAAGGIEISRPVLDLVEAEARAAYERDEEACGYLCGPAAEPLLCDSHVALANMANKLHAMDPQTYFRTGRTYFAFNEKKFDDAVQRGREEGKPVKVLYHSHLDAGAHFSPTDRAVLSFGEPPATEGGAIAMGPGPQWPLAFLVTSVRLGQVAEHRLYVWDASAGDFAEAPFTVV